ncbi:MAG: hypothetical protein QNJ37_16200 [Crocosphaera sp.]|nr:hypothetical protein [Crocosphaera sp.]
MLKKMLQCKQVIPLVATLLSTVVVSPAEAITVNLGTIQDFFGNDITGVTSIEGIQIIEKGVELPDSDFTFRVTSTYRIDFLYGTFNDIFGDPTNPDFDTSCDLGESNKLCFWGNDPQAELVLDQMNGAINALPTVPENVIGTIIDPDGNDVPPIPGINSRNFYLVPLDFDGVNVITSRQGTNDNTNTWVTDPLTTNTAVSVTSYAGARLTNQEFVVEIPESSNLIGIAVTGLSIILVTKKK